MTNTATRWRRIGFVGCCFIFGSLCWSIYSSVRERSFSDAADDNQHINVEVPKSHFSPAEVVTLQVQSIRDSTSEPEQLEVCYSLASPQNREVTGPFAHFAQMLMSPPYDRLATCQSWQVGSAAFDANFAAVLVSTVSNEGDSTVFRFILTKHEEAPYTGGCWLTEAVDVLDQLRLDENANSSRDKEPLLD